MKKPKIQKTYTLDGSTLMEIRVKDPGMGHVTPEKLAGSIAEMLKLGATHVGFSELERLVYKEFPILKSKEVQLQMRNMLYSDEKQRLRKGQGTKDPNMMYDVIESMYAEMQLGDAFDDYIGGLLLKNYGYDKLDKFYDSVIWGIPHPLD